MDPGTGRYISRDTWAKEYNMFMNPMVEKRIFMKRSTIFAYIFCLCIGLAVFGCSENNENRPSITPSRPASTITTAPSRTPPPASTATPVITLTPIPAPTLPPDEAQALVLDLLYNPPCDLPCWWGITPGETTWEEANKFLRSFGHVLYGEIIPEGETFSEQYFFKVPKEINEYRESIRLTLGVEHGIVKEIQVSPGEVSNYSLSELLKKYGPPEEIWINRYDEVIDTRERFDLWYLMYYGKHGIIINSLAAYSMISDDLVIGCINSDYLQPEGPVIFLWEPNLQISFFTAISEGINPRNPPSHSEEAFMLLENLEIGGMDEQSFYDVFVNPGIEVCIKSPREKWPFIFIP